MGAPGWPEFAFCTISAESTRNPLMAICVALSIFSCSTMLQPSVVRERATEQKEEAASECLEPTYLGGQTDPDSQDEHDMTR